MAEPGSDITCFLQKEKGHFALRPMVSEQRYEFFIMCAILSIPLSYVESKAILSFAVTEMGIILVLPNLNHLKKFTKYCRLFCLALLKSPSRCVTLQIDGILAKCLVVRTKAG